MGNQSRAGGNTGLAGWRLTWVVALAIGAVAVPIGRAHACSCLPPLLGRGQPVDEAVDVPLDVRPWVVTPVSSPEDIVLEDERGVAVPAEVVIRSGGLGGYDCVATSAELIPATDLLPNSRYTIRVLVETGYEGVPRTRSFTTGTARIGAQAPAPPAARFGIVRADNARNSCVYSAYRGCVAADDDDTLLQVTMLYGDMEAGQFFTRGQKTLVLSEDQDLDDLCIVFRARDAAGNLSAPVTSCVADLTIRQEEASEEQALRVCDLSDAPLAVGADETPTHSAHPDHGPRTDDGASEPAGCRIGGQGADHALPMLALLGLWLRRRRY